MVFFIRFMLVVKFYRDFLDNEVVVFEFINWNFCNLEFLVVVRKEWGWGIVWFFCEFWYR